MNGNVPPLRSLPPSRLFWNAIIYVTQVTADESIDSTPAWSPDEARLPFRTARDRNNESYVINVNGLEPANLTNNNADDTAPVWPP
jgi:Tol biopolymer transport system component